MECIGGQFANQNLATDQGASGHLAAFGYAGHDALGNAVLELSGGKIIQKKQRFRTLHDQVIDAHGDQINADAVMPVIIDRELEFRADTVVGGDEQGILVPRCLQIEKSSETAQFRIRTGPRRGFGQRRYRLDQGIARRNGNTGFRVGVRIRFILLFTHNLCD